MTRKPEHVKHVSALTPDDFRSHPIWSWYDDDDAPGLVMPIDQGYLSDEERVEQEPRAFMLAELTLHDGTRMQGEISLEVDEKQVYGVKFFQGDEVFGFLLADPSELKGWGPAERQGEELLRGLGKETLTQIFPVRYETPFHYGDGTPIAGEIELVGDWGELGAS